jgi:hypothetical protein
VSFSIADAQEYFYKNNYPYVISILNSDGKTNLIYGTGIIAQHDNDLFLITASHIARYMGENSIVRFSCVNMEYKDIKLKSIVSDSLINWKHHEFADMAIIEIVNLNQHLENAINNTISSDLFIQSKESINIGDDFLHVGFPLNYPVAFGTNTIFLPYVYKTQSINIIMKLPRTDNRNLICDFISVRPCTFSGSSGGPLIRLPIDSEQFKIAGINHGIIKDIDNTHVMSLFTPMYYFFDFFRIH